jgi:hypothetical protein
MPSRGPWWPFLRYPDFTPWMGSQDGTALAHASPAPGPSNLRVRLIAACSKPSLSTRIRQRAPGRLLEHRAGQRHSVSGVRVGEDLSSLRNFCSANCQNSASRSSGRRLAPTVYTLAPRSLLGSGNMSSRLAHRPACMGVGTHRQDRAWRLASLEAGRWIQVHMKPASSLGRLAHKTQAMRALHRMAFAGTVPLLAKISSPLR